MNTRIGIVLLFSVFLTPAISWSDRVLTLLEPAGGEVWATGEHTVRWALGGDMWFGNETLTIECTRDGGSTWSVWTIAAPAAPCAYPWNITEFPASPNYQVRIMCNEYSEAWDVGGTFTIGASASYYVNDTSTDNDFYCTAPGSPEADGLTPGTPNTSIRYILNTHALGAGDTVWVDTGYYLLENDILIQAEDQGAPGNPMTILGSPGGAILDRNGGPNVFYITGDYIQLGDAGNPLHMTRADVGAYLTGTGNVISNCEVYGCGFYGIRRDAPAPDCIISECYVHDNLHWGIGIIVSQNTASLVDNIISGNGEGGIWASPIGLGSTAIEINNNLVVDNGGYGVYGDFANDGVIRLKNNTIARNASHAVYGKAQNDAGPVRFQARNNILQSIGPDRCCMYLCNALEGALDYNTYHAIDGAATGYYAGATHSWLSQWRASTGQDGHSMSDNPLFVDPDNGNYTLMSTGGRMVSGEWVFDVMSSSCIDSGDPADNASVEHEPNGSRINQGACGNRIHASRTPMERLVTLLEPLGGETWLSGARTIRWNRTGQSWNGTETLTLEYSTDTGNTWTLLEDNASAAANSFPWEVSGLLASFRYQIRITCNEDTSATDLSGMFQIGNPEGEGEGEGETPAEGEGEPEGEGEGEDEGETPAEGEGEEEEEPAILFSYVPALECSISYVHGRVENIPPSEYGLLLWVHVDGAWWGPKPNLSTITPINSAGNWSQQVLVEPTDFNADAIGAVAVPLDAVLEASCWPVSCQEIPLQDRELARAVVYRAAGDCVGADTLALSFPLVMYQPNYSDPGNGVYPDESQLTENLSQLFGAGFRGLTFYASTNTMTLIPGLAREEGFQTVGTGVWQVYNAAERDAAVDLASDTDFYIVGVEGLSRTEDAYTKEDLLAALGDLSLRTGKPVTTAETPGTWLANPDLVASVDFVAVNIHPWWAEKRTPESASTYFQTVYDTIVALAAGKPVLVTETGMPTGGGHPDASLALQQGYFEMIEQTDIPFVYFEAYDQFWKTGEVSDDYVIGTHWGLYDRCGQLKQEGVDECQVEGEGEGEIEGEGEGEVEGEAEGEIEDEGEGEGEIEDEGEGEAEGEGEIEGEGEGEIPILHPADINEDFRIVIGEAIGYLAGWQQGSNPIAYAIRAAYLWQNGEDYTYDPQATPPLCWILIDN
ncbi:MAG: hypothetical protein BWY09_00619 [Candidatus Hydrogenedentes bacterium ADurb.Bin179]|nr:MAG: hypothetical protein BWY09_00619 [Candidatus Hydrogenedentes bacterium ADurb.Bin179]